MPNDDPTANDPTPVPTPEPAAAAPSPAATSQPTPHAPAPQAGDNQLAKTLEAVVGAVRQINSRLDGIEGNTAPKPAPADPNSEADAIIQRFTEDPGGTIDERAAAAAEKVILEKMGPGMARDLQNRREMFLDREAQRVDDRFGRGFFEEKIRPQLVTGDRESPGKLESLNIWLQADPEAIRGVIDGVVGREFMSDTTHGDLMDRYSKADQERRNAQQPPNIMGPGVAGSPDALREGRLSPELKGQIERIQEAGFDFTEDTVRAAKANGKTLSGWLAAQKGAN